VAAVVRTVVALATQTYGTWPVKELAPRCSLLLIHGKSDKILPFSCSENVYKRAGQAKRLLLYDRARHGLDEVASEVRQAVHSWIAEQLKRTKAGVAQTGRRARRSR